MASSTRSIEVPTFSVSQKAPNKDAKIPESQWTNALWYSPLRSAYDHRKLMFVLQTFENCSTVFGPQWLQLSTKNGKYRPFDMNMPFTIPALKFSSSLEFDPPLTVFGKFCAQTCARSLRNQLFKMSFIVSAPSLRCVQTAAIFAEAMQCPLYVLEELAEPEIIFDYGSKHTLSAKYLNIDELRKLGFKVKGLRLNERHPPCEGESELGVMSRIAGALRELTSQTPPGPSLIIGDALVLKIANSIASLPEGYTDPLKNLPFTVPSFELNEDAIEMDRYDFTQLSDYFSGGTMNVFCRQRNGTIERIPYSMPKITVMPGEKAEEKEWELKATNPKNVLSFLQVTSSAAAATGDNAGSEISI